MAYNTAVSALMILANEYDNHEFTKADLSSIINTS